MVGWKWSRTRQLCKAFSFVSLFIQGETEHRVDYWACPRTLSWLLLFLVLVFFSVCVCVCVFRVSQEMAPLPLSDGYFKISSYLLIFSVGLTCMTFTSCGMHRKEHLWEWLVYSDAVANSVWLRCCVSRDMLCLSLTNWGGGYSEALVTATIQRIMCLLCVFECF